MLSLSRRDRAASSGLGGWMAALARLSATLSASARGAGARPGSVWGREREEASS